MDVTEQGSIIVDPRSYNRSGMERLGEPKKAVRGRVKVEDNSIKFLPYDQANKKPTFKNQVVVGSTTISITEDKVKISFLVPRHLTKQLMPLYIQSEIDEVKRRLTADVYDSIVSLDAAEKGGEL